MPVVNWSTWCDEVLGCLSDAVVGCGGGKREKLMRTKSSTKQQVCVRGSAKTFINVVTTHLCCKRIKKLRGGAGRRAGMDLL